MITYALILLFGELHSNLGWVVTTIELWKEDGWVIQTQHSIATFRKLHNPHYLNELGWAAIEVVIVGFALWRRRRHTTFFKKIKQPSSWKTYIVYIALTDVVLFFVCLSIMYLLVLVFVYLWDSGY